MKMVKKHLQIYTLTLCWVMSSTDDSCETSKGTVVRVNKCPENEIEWIEAAKRKNCSALTGSCSEPDRFFYHCVLNPFVNDTLEVCAYQRKIFLGRCTEYSILGNLIQQSSVSCSAFPIPCPAIYISTDAYKYQDCYKLVQRARQYQTTAVPTVMSTIVQKEVTQKTLLFSSRTSFEMTSSGDFTAGVDITERSESEDVLKIRIIIPVCCVLILMVGVALVWRWRRKRRLKHIASSSETKESAVESVGLMQQCNIEQEQIMKFSESRCQVN